MLAKSYEDLEKRLQAQLKESDTSHNGAEFKPESDGSKCRVDTKADRPSFSRENTPAVMDEREEKADFAAGSQNEE